MAFLFFAANKTVNPRLLSYSYCLHSKQSGMENCFLHLPFTWHIDSSKGRYPILPSLLFVFSLLILHLLLWFPFMTLLFHCVLSTLLSLICPRALLFLISVSFSCISAYLLSLCGFPLHVCEYQQELPIPQTNRRTIRSSRWKWEHIINCKTTSGLQDHKSQQIVAIEISYI